jgi:tetratricopeptide (TPR) repeat protein
MTATRTWRVFTDVQRGDPEAALERARGYLSDEVAQGSALARAAFAATLARDTAAALEYARRAAETSPGADLIDMRRIEVLLGFALVASGDRAAGSDAIEDGIDAVRRATADGADGWDPPWELASAYAALGDGAESLRHLELAVDAGFPHPILLRLDPTFDLLRGDARFGELVRRAELEIEAQREESRGAEVR